MSENNQELDRNQLFVQALQERMAALVVEYETKVAELRVEFTLITNERDQLLKAIEGNKGEDAVQDPDPQAR